VFGSARGGKRLTPADLVIDVCGDVKKIRNQQLTNMSRFLQSLDRGGDIEAGIVITDEIRNAVKRYRYKIEFDQSEEAFTDDPDVKALFAELKVKLRTAAQARNHLRRTLYGIRKMTDVRIPTRDGSYVLGDIYRPIGEGKYPAIVAFGGYGKVFTGHGHICNEEELLEYEELEDEYFEKNPDNAPWENFEVVNTVDWVPQGYIVVRIDERGVGKTPGTYEQFSLQEAKDYYDSIEWIARQPWCNGNVGTWGISYWAMTQWNMAQLQPPSLKAMVPVFGSNSPFPGYVFNGGLYNRFNHVVKNSCGEWKGIEWVDVALANPFYDPDLYGPQGSLCISPDLSKIIAPLWSVMPQLHPGIHIRDNSEGYIHAGSKHKKLSIVVGQMGGWPYSKEALAECKAFYDYWLRGVDNGVMDGPPVKMMVRSGWGSYFWQDENEWPIARTKYTRYYLDAAPSMWQGDGKRHDFLKLSTGVPVEKMSTTYPADPDIGVEPGSPPGGGHFLPKRVGGAPAWSYGVSFVTDPMPENALIAGYLKLVIWVSSTSSDMDIFASVRVMDENNEEIRYGFPNRYGYYIPVTLGWLKVSHRKLDPERSTIYRPYHTHLKKDYQPLTPGEIVEAEVEIWPTTAFIKKGHRIRLDVQPADGFDHPVLHLYDESYHKGASNTIYTGPDHPSYLQLPIIPPKL
jgi:predicted acyl esterase